MGVSRLENLLPPSGPGSRSVRSTSVPVETGTVLSVRREEMAVPGTRTLLTIGARVYRFLSLSQDPNGREITPSFPSDGGSTSSLQGTGNP